LRYRGDAGDSAFALFGGQETPIVLCWSLWQRVNPAVTEAPAKDNEKPVPLPF
jgi:hypothetical protein